MTSTANSSLAAAHRKALQISIASLCVEVGFSSTDEVCLETLTEMLQSYLTELGCSSRAFSEISGRTVPMVTDVAMAVSQMGCSLSGLVDYRKKHNRNKIPKQEQLNSTPTLPTLEAGQRRNHPSHIPDNLPPLPDPHTYIKTATFKKPDKNYSVIRTKAATQQRDIERALTHFIAKTGDSQTLFPGDSNLFPLIACSPSPRSYLDILSPPEHDVAPHRQTNTETEQASNDDNQTQDDALGSSQSSGEGPSTNNAQQRQKRKSEPADITDNPFLRKTRKPKYKKKR